ncbi:MAG: hypothetical protein II476_08690, partial [Bacteroidales bacterium]|nr:hypothetical protein [Bacteroidales bacterium]
TRRNNSGNNNNSTTRSNTSTSTTRSSSSSATRSSSSSATRSSSTSVTRSSGSQDNKNGNQSATRSSSTSATRSSSSSATRTSSTSVTRSSSTSATRTSSTSASSTARSISVQDLDKVTRSSSVSGSNVRTNSNVTAKGLSPVSDEVRNSSSSNNGNYGDYRVERNNVLRIHPRERDYMTYEVVGRFYSHDPHYYGFRIYSLPARYKRVSYFGVTYYMYDNIYYRPYAGHYVVCRPPIGVVIERSIRNLVFSTVRFAYYSNVYRTYNGWDSYSRYIDEQNRIIARNNAVIAAQNSYIGMNLSSAQSSYDIAYRLGLAQSYAYADRDYFYNDGVFYIVNGRGRYEVIVPPAGALVEFLPEDYDIITLGGAEYYRVDDTVYRTVLVGGRPYLEVLGQMYGSMARKYNSYYSYY